MNYEENQLSIQKFSCLFAKSSSSSDYEFYYLRFRSDFEKYITLKSFEYDMMKAEMPQRFDLKMLDDVFVSWFSTWENGVSDLPPLSMGPIPKVGRLYKHDHLTYRADHYISIWNDGTKENIELCIKLTNNGFIYSTPESSEGIQVYKNSSNRHRSTTIVKLDNVHSHSFEEMKKFARSYLEVKNISVKLFYDFLKDRFDFKAYDMDTRSRGVVITFGNYPPIDDEIDDYWLDDPCTENDDVKENGHDLT